MLLKNDACIYTARQRKRHLRENLAHRLETLKKRLLRLKFHEVIFCMFRIKDFAITIKIVYGNYFSIVVNDLIIGYQRHLLLYTATTICLHRVRDKILGTFLPNCESKSSINFRNFSNFKLFRNSLVIF